MLEDVIFSLREIARIYFHFLFCVKRLDLFLLHLVTIPELAVQSQLQEYWPQKERNDGLEI
jgi:hypothetical protein